MARPHPMASLSDEEFRRAALALAGAGRQWRCRGVVVTSATRGEGTTAAAVLLGRHLIRDAGLKPVVIELNRDRPALRRMFDLDDSRTLDAAISDGRCARSCVQHDPDGLPVIPAGDRRAPTPAASNLETALCRAVQDLQSVYDFIVVDGPPILESADVFVAARVVPQLVLTVGAGRVAEESLEQACRQIEDARIDLIGTILVSQKRVIPAWIDRLFAAQGDVSR